MKATCERQAVVWDAIERLAFRPPSTKDQRRWLAIYGKSLHQLWQLQPSDVTINGIQGFDSWLLHVCCNYQIDSAEKYGATIVNAKTSKPACWQIHVDPGFFSRSSCYTGASESYPKQDIERHLEHDVQEALDGMIFHPRSHAHGNELGIDAKLEGPTALETREIRLGGGIENGFVFLAHLRYQFCLVSNVAREEEREYFVRLFTDAIKNKIQSIPPATMFQLRA